MNMAQRVYNSSPNTPKLSGRSSKKDWNEYQHLATQGRYIEPKLFSGFQNHQIRLTSVKKQLYNPKLPSIRGVERDEVLHRLADEHCRHTTTFTEEQFQNLDRTREASFIELSGLNWHETGKALMGMSTSSFIHVDSSLEFGARLRPDKSQKDNRISQLKLYRTSTSSSGNLRRSNTHSYANNICNQNSRIRFYCDTKNSFKPVQSIFRSSSMYVDNSANSSNLKCTQV